MEISLRSPFKAILPEVNLGIDFIPGTLHTYF